MQKRLILPVIILIATGINFLIKCTVQFYYVLWQIKTKGKYLTKTLLEKEIYEFYKNYFVQFIIFII